MTIVAPVTLPSRFRLEQEIGRGGMAVVYRAHDLQLDRPVAIKVLSESYSTAVGVERFQREISVTARLAHPGIVTLFDSGESAGRLYYVMPFVPGETLRGRLQRERRMTMEDAAAIGADVAEALAFAHAAGIVHRDVKPENIFVVSGRAVLADFGIARVSDAREGESDNLTTDGMIIGTIAYLSPEQATAEGSVDGRSDLYSLGCVLYELLTGAPPFSGPPMAVIAKHLTSTPADLGTHGIRISPDMGNLIARMLDKDPGQRPNAEQVVRSLRAAQQGWEMPRPAPASVEADRLVEEGVRSYRFGASGGPAARSHLEQAMVYFRRALSLNPRHARALTSLGNCHFLMGNAGYLPLEDARARGRELFLEALAADDQVADVHCSLAKLALYFDDDVHSAFRHVERAAALDPRDAEVLRLRTITLKIQGRIEEAVECAQSAATLVPDMPSLQNLLGDILLTAGRAREAVDALRRAVALQPGYGPALARLEQAWTSLGEFDGAVEVRASRLRPQGHADRADLLLAEAAKVGAEEARRRDVQRDLDELLSAATRSDPFAEIRTTRSIADQIVVAYAELGEWSHAMDWVERAFAARPARLRRMLTDQPFDRHGLKTDPRYLRLLRVTGMEELA